MMVIMDDALPKSADELWVALFRPFFPFRVASSTKSVIVTRTLITIMACKLTSKRYIHGFIAR